MTQPLQAYFGQGLKPQAFVHAMTRNQDAFLSWYDQFTWPSEADQQFFTAGGFDVHCLILAADWCGDVVRNVPVVFRLMEAAGIDTDVLIMEQHLDLMDQFLTYGGRSIPVVLFVSPDGALIGRWGPRPAYVQEPMAQFKQTVPPSDPQYDEKIAAARAEVRRRYGEGTSYQADIVREVRALLEPIRH